MARVNDVAAYILQELGPMSSMKLQKLVYYSKAWHLVWEQEELFPERIEAWANGPVVYELFDNHRGSFTVQPPWRSGHPERLTKSERESIDVVIDDYGNMTGRALSALTHSEAPWRDARGDLPPNARCSNEITPAAMYDFYSWLLVEADDARRLDDVDWSAF